MKISVIVCSRTQADSLRIAAHYAVLLGGRDWEFVPMIGAPSMAVGYNAGIDKSNGDTLVFSHDDVEFLRREKFYNNLMDSLVNRDVVGLAGTDKLIGPSWIMAGLGRIFGAVAHRMDGGCSCCIYGPSIWRACAIDGLFMAARRQVVEGVRFDESFGWHHYDLDWSYRCELAGFSVGVTRSLSCIHNSGGKHDAAWEASGRRFMQKHATTITPEQPPRFSFAWQWVKDEAEALMGEK